MRITSLTSNAVRSTEKLPAFLTAEECSIWYLIFHQP